MFNKPPGCPRRSPYLCVLCHLQEDPGSLTAPLIFCPCPWEAPPDHQAPGPISLEPQLQGTVHGLFLATG